MLTSFEIIWHSSLSVLPSQQALSACPTVRIPRNWRDVFFARSFCYVHKSRLVIQSLLGRDGFWLVHRGLKRKLIRQDLRETYLQLGKEKWVPLTMFPTKSIHERCGMRESRVRQKRNWHSSVGNARGDHLDIDIKMGNIFFFCRQLKLFRSRVKFYAEFYEWVVTTKNARNRNTHTTSEKSPKAKPVLLACVNGLLVFTVGTFSICRYGDWQLAPDQPKARKPDAIKSSLREFIAALQSLSR